MNMHATIARPAPQEFLLALAVHERSLRNLAQTLCLNREGAEALLVRVLARARRDHASHSPTASMAVWLMKMMREEFKAPTSPEELTRKPVAAAPAPDPVKAADHRVIDITPFLPALKPPKSDQLGTPPELAWIEISLLRIDQSYQREILRRGRNNVIKIAAEFNWAMFAPVIVSRIADGLYAIVDGQHRTTAAACRGITRVPCQIIEASPSQQAAAFAAINGNVTQMSSLQLHAARVAAGDDEAAQLDAVCAAGGAAILKYPVPANLIKPGQTLAVSCLANALKVYGAQTVTAALLCLTRSGDGNVGMLRAPIIRGLCQVLSQRPAMVADSEAAVAIAHGIDFSYLLEEASIDAKRTRTQVSNVIVARLAVVFGPPAARTAT